jgi:hypothetical protein
MLMRKRTCGQKKQKIQKSKELNFQGGDVAGIKTVNEIEGDFALVILKEKWRTPFGTNFTFDSNAKDIISRFPQLLHRQR